MGSKVIRFFLYSAGLMLVLTAMAKLISANGDARILNEYDPLLMIKFRYVFWGVGIAELVVAWVCIFGQRPAWAAGLLAWLSTVFLSYRAGLVWMKYQKPCSCLGALTENLGITPQAADSVMKVVLLYFLVGSYATLLWLLRRQRVEKAAVAEPVGAESVPTSG